MLEGALIVARFVHFVATLTLFGISLFPLYTDMGCAGALDSRERDRKTMLWAAGTGLLSAIFWYKSVVANMTGSPSGFLDSVAAWTVLTETDFGAVWIARVVLGMVILVFLLPRMTSFTARWRYFLPALCAGLLVSLAGVGHTQVDDGMDHVVHVGADGLHLLAAGAWLGGLVSLFSLVARAVVTSSPDRNAEASNAAIRFSGMGYAAVATLIVSGLINSWFLVGSVANLASPYGLLLVLKVGLFAGMLALAGLNRFLIVPKLVRASNEPTGGLGTLQRHILGEQALGLLVILCVSALGTMQPAVNSP